MTTPTPHQPRSRFARAWHWLVGPPPRDHRGRKVRVIRLLNFRGQLGSRFSRLPPEINDRVLADLSKISPMFMWKQNLLIAAIVLPLVLYVLTVHQPRLASFLSPAFGPRFLSIIAAVGLFSIFPAVTTYLGRNASKSLTIDSTLKCNHCPSCGYSLEAAKLDPSDGCTLCPECGAAWKLSPHPAAPAPPLS